MFVDKRRRHSESVLLVLLQCFAGVESATTAARNARATRYASGSNTLMPAMAGIPLRRTLAIAVPAEGAANEIGWEGLSRPGWRALLAHEEDQDFGHESGLGHRFGGLGVVHRCIVHSPSGYAHRSLRVRNSGIRIRPWLRRCARLGRISATLPALQCSSAFCGPQSSRPYSVDLSRNSRSHTRSLACHWP